MGVLQPRAGNAEPVVTAQLLEGDRALGAVETDPAMSATYVGKALDLARTLGNEAAAADVRRLQVARSVR